MKIAGLILFASGIYLRYLDSANVDAAIAFTVIGLLLITQETKK